MVKNYVLDTNILLDNPNNIFGFEDNNVIICGTTLQELDSKKNMKGDLGYSAREVTRVLDELRQQGDLLKGVKMENGGKVIVEVGGVNEGNLPAGFSISVPDNRIISTCVTLKEQKKKPILVTNDILMRVNASACGVEVQSYRNDQIKDTSYTGHIEVVVPQDMIGRFYANKLGVDEIEEIIGEELLENQFITLKDGGQASAIMIYQDGMLVPIPDVKLQGWITPKNAMQRFAIHALMDPSISLVIMKGPAGTAKTFLALATALSQSYLGQDTAEDIYKRILISKPNKSNDEDFGYLKGSLEEKMAPLLASYFDNLKEILSHHGEEEYREVTQQIDDLMFNETIEICPLYAIRGRTISRSILICDEVQNANKQLIKDVITRAGEGTKIILAGDTAQIDTPTLDSRNNGLSYTIDRMKGSRSTAIITFDAKHCVRSALAEDAIKRMR